MEVRVNPISVTPSWLEAEFHQPYQYYYYCSSSDIFKAKMRVTVLLPSLLPNSIQKPLSEAKLGTHSCQQGLGGRWHGGPRGAGSEPDWGEKGSLCIREWSGMEYWSPGGVRKCPHGLGTRAMQVRRASTSTGSNDASVALNTPSAEMRSSKYHSLQKGTPVS